MSVLPSSLKSARRSVNAESPGPAEKFFGPEKHTSGQDAVDAAAVSVIAALLVAIGSA